MGQLKDITGAQEVEVSIRSDSKVLWINVDGTCQLRICNIDNLTLDDHRKPPKRPRPTKWETEAMRLKDQNVSLLSVLELALDPFNQATRNPDGFTTGEPSWVSQARAIIKTNKE